ncbi:MAG: hypothetical protein JW847_08835 [Candidatus Omnitrophica bacterium]|nr:hypothetical protein [Candidatus Omnitrophota bacterium]
MTPIKIIALVFIVLALVKLLVISINPSSWKTVIKAVYGKPILTTALSLIAAVVILMFLLKEMTIVQVFASMAFMAALMMAQFAAMRKEVLEMSEKFLNDKSVFQKLRFSLFIWTALMAWALYEIFV